MRVNLVDMLNKNSFKVRTWEATVLHHCRNSTLDADSKSNTTEVADAGCVVAIVNYAALNSDVILYHSLCFAAESYIMTTVEIWDGLKAWSRASKPEYGC